MPDCPAILCEGAPLFRLLSAYFAAESLAGGPRNAGLEYSDYRYITLT